MSCGFPRRLWRARFYLDQKGTGIAQLLLALLGWLPFFLGWLVLGVWLLVDLFLIPDMASRFNMDLIRALDDVRTKREEITPASRVVISARAGDGPRLTQAHSSPLPVTLHNPSICAGFRH